jgi:hypothetical protein
MWIVITVYTVRRVISLGTLTITYRDQDSNHFLFAIQTFTVTKLHENSRQKLCNLPEICICIDK